MKSYLKNILEKKELSQKNIELNTAQYRYGANIPNEIRYGFIEYYLRRFDDFEKAKQLFDNNESKELFDILILFKSLGHRYIKLPRNTDNYQEFIKRVNSNPINATILEEKFKPIGNNMKKRIIYLIKILSELSKDFLAKHYLLIFIFFPNTNKKNENLNTSIKLIQNLFKEK